jgi:hypothetical protein
MSEALRELEAALEASFSLDNLQVYGDYLMSIGDPRGELIAVDVHVARHGNTPEVAHRRRRAIRTWLELPPEIDPTQGGWESVRFAFGFVEDVRVDFASRILASRAGPFVRGITLTNKTASVEHVLHQLGLASRPWLTRLTIAPRFKGDPPGVLWRSEAPNLSNKEVPAIIAVTPRLARLELAGHRLLREFPHPALRSLRVDAIDAFLPILERRAPMPALDELTLAFERAPDERVIFSRPWPDLVPAASFPALRRLDLSPCEAQRATTDTQLCVFDVLATLGVREQLVDLRLPSIRNLQEAQLVQRAITRMPELRRVEVMRGWGKHAPRTSRVELVELPVPWPRRDTVVASTSVWVRAPDDRVAIELPLALTIEHCDRSFETFEPAAREAWTAWWEVLERLRESSAEAPLPSTILRQALDTLGFLDASRSELRPWAQLRHHVREADGGEVWIRRRRPPA